MEINPLRAGFALGGLLGLWHLAWSALVALGFAQAVLDFVLRIHFIEIQATIAAFDIKFAALLVAVTAAVGFVIGYVFARAWNGLREKA